MVHLYCRTGPANRPGRHAARHTDRQMQNMQPKLMRLHLCKSYGLGIESGPFRHPLLKTFMGWSQDRPFFCLASAVHRPRLYHRRASTIVISRSGSRRENRHRASVPGVERSLRSPRFASHVERHFRSSSGDGQYRGLRLCPGETG